MHNAYARTQMWNAKMSYSISTYVGQRGEVIETECPEDESGP